MKKRYHKWCRFNIICNLFRKNQFICTHHGGSDQCGKYRELTRKNENTIKSLIFKWNKKKLKN